MHQFVQHPQITSDPQKFFCSMFELLEWEWWINFQSDPEQKESWSASNICKDIADFQRQLRHDNHRYCKGHYMCLRILRLTFDSIIENNQSEFQPHGFVSAVDILQMNYEVIEDAAKLAIDFAIQEVTKPTDDVQNIEYTHFSNDDYQQGKQLLKNLREFIVSSWIPNSYVIYIYITTLISSFITSRLLHFIIFFFFFVPQDVLILSFITSRPISFLCFIIFLKYVSIYIYIYS